MSFIHSLVNTLLTNFWTIIISLFVCYVSYKLLRFYQKVWSLPPGPLPLPVIGNILSLRGSGYYTEALKRCAKKYGPVFTIWLGSKPYIFIADAKILRDAFNKVEFSGRSRDYLNKLFSNEKHQNIVGTDYGPTYEALRTVTVSAVHKYSKSEELIYWVNDCVERMVKEMIDVDGVDKEFCPNDYIYYLIQNIISTTTFGRNFSTDDPAFKKVQFVLRDFTMEIGARFILWEFSPALRMIDWKMVNKYEEGVKDFINTVKALYENHYKDYDESNERDICDALITAKNTALRESKDSARYLNDENLSMCLGDLLIAGSDTTANAIIWGILYMTYYPEVQQKLRQEIESEIGDRIPIHEDRYRLHYLMAFIWETIRIRNTVPAPMPKKTLSKVELENYTIPEGTGVFMFLQFIQTDEKYWPKGEEFIPERFLVNGKYTTLPNEANIPFGVGRRICVGEKFVIADLFLVFVRFLQLTANYNIVLGSNGGLAPDPDQVFIMAPKKYNLVFKEL